LGTVTRQNFYDPSINEDVYRTGGAVGYNLMLDYTARHFGYTIFGTGQTRDYRSEVGFIQRTNTNEAAAFFRISNDPKPNAKFVSWRIFGGNDFSYDFQGRSQNSSQNVNANLQFTKQTYLTMGFSQFYERLVEEEFGPKRSDTQAGAFFGGPERSAAGRSIWVNVETNPIKRFNAYAFVGHRQNVFDYDFGNGPKYPRVSPAALADPNAPLDPGPANTFDIQCGTEVKPVDALTMSLNYSRYRYRRIDTGKIVFVDNIYSYRTTYQFTRFVFARVRVDYDSLAANMRGQYLFGWTPSPGTSFYVGYDDNVNINGYNPFSSLREPGIRRNSRTFFIKTSYLFRRSI
jgi:hypothetical protein